MHEIENDKCPGNGIKYFNNYKNNPPVLSNPVKYNGDLDFKVSVVNVGSLESASWLSRGVNILGQGGDENEPLTVLW